MISERTNGLERRLLRVGYLGAAFGGLCVAAAAYLLLAAYAGVLYLDVPAAERHFGGFINGLKTGLRALPIGACVAVLAAWIYNAAVLHMPQIAVKVRLEGEPNPSPRAASVDGEDPPIRPGGRDGDDVRLADLARPPVTDARKSCPSCGADLGAERSFCPECDHSFE